MLERDGKEEYVHPSRRCGRRKPFIDDDCGGVEERSRAFDWTGSHCSFVDLELQLVGGPLVRGCRCRLRGHPSHVPFPAALSARPIWFARGLLLRCSWGNGCAGVCGSLRSDQSCLRQEGFLLLWTQAQLQLLAPLLAHSCI